MKVLIITVHRDINYGSALQAYALNRFLKLNGFDVETIDYSPSIDVKNLGLVDKTVTRFILRQQVAKIVFGWQMQKLKSNFRLFVEQNIILTPRKYYTFKDLEEEPPKADIYITGSDQLWNGRFLCGRDPAYYLTFTTGGKKMSYAVSLGCDNIDQDELNRIKSLINDFDAISVREQSGKRQLENVGVNSVKHVLDPVLLLDKQEYLRLVDRHQLGKYLLVYIFRENDLVNKLAFYIAKKMGLKVVSIGGLRKKVNSEFHDRVAGPTDFISYIANAEFIITTSFHCLSFALMMNKNFAVVLPDLAPARLEDILEQVGLENRIIRDMSKADEVMEEIDYERITPLLEWHINASRQYLLETLAILSSNN